MYKINPILQGYILHQKRKKKVPDLRQTRNDPGKPKTFPDGDEVLPKTPVA